MSAPDATAWSDHAARTFTRAGYRSSSARMAVVDLLGRQRCCLSAREITERLRAEGSDVGTASVYRALELLDEMGLVQRLDAGDGATRYEPAHPSGDHHHHVVCERCGKLTPFQDHELERAITQAAARLDHEVDGHEVVLRGRCSVCSAPSRRLHTRSGRP